LADLYLAVLEAARAVITVLNRASRIHLCVDKAKTERDRSCPEQTFTGTENDRELPNT